MVISSRSFRWVGLSVVVVLATGLGYALGFRGRKRPSTEIPIVRQEPPPPRIPQKAPEPVPWPEPTVPFAWTNPREPVAILGMPGFSHDAIVSAAAVSSDSKSLLTLDATGMLYRWDLAAGNLLYKKRMPGPPVDRPALLCSPARPRAILFSREASPGAVRLLDLEAGKEIRRFGPCRSPVLSSDGGVLAGSDGLRVRRWRVETGAELPAFEDPEFELLWVAASPDGTSLAASFRGTGGFVIWDAISGKRRLRWKGDDVPATAISFSPDGKSLAIGDFWGVTIRDAHDAGATWACDTFDGHPLRITRDGRWLIGTRFRRMLGIWELKSREQMAQIHLPADAGNFLEATAGGETVIRSRGSTVHLIPIEDLILKEDPPSAEFRTAVRFPSDRAVAADSNGTVRTFDSSSGREIVSKSTLPGETVALSEDRLLLKTGEHELVVWDMERGAERVRVKDPDPVVAEALSADGRTMVFGTLTGRVVIWDVENRRERVQVRSKHAGDGIRAIAISPDGRLLAWADGNGAVTYADALTGQEVLRFRPRAGRIRSIAFSPDGKTLATGGEGGEVLLWGREAGVDPEILAPFNEPVVALAFSPEGRRIACATWGELVLASTRSNVRMFRYGRCYRRICSIAFSPDGNRLVAGIQGSPALVWAVPPEE